ncbi:MAG: TonB family protein [Acidobacteria bacterium]|nr:TonB family protein [Acidobacteriota bacterium]MBV9625211.1 TonB family protein [Acidobacteriota bacterium]
MATLELKPPPRTSAPEPELNLLMPKGSEQSLWDSLTHNFKETFFPTKLPPLVLTSRPIPVKDIWGFYSYTKRSATLSSIAHIIALTAILVGTYYLGKKVVAQPAKPTVTLVAPSMDIPTMKPAKTQSGGGGGGGDRDKFQAPKGNIPKPAMEQITPPAIVVRNAHPKLAVEPTVVMPPQVKIALNSPNLGNPTAAMPSGPPSNGTGSGGGIGSGSGGGIGVGTGPGVGEGRGGGIGGGVFRVGGGVSAPKAVYAPDPEYSEEARKAKYQGVCVLSLIVGPDGKPRDIHVARSLGLGLDEKAIEAVNQWKFDPAQKDGKPVAVAISVEVTFRLY